MNKTIAFFLSFFILFSSFNCESRNLGSAFSGHPIIEAKGYPSGWNDLPIWITSTSPYDN